MTGDIQLWSVIIISCFLNLITCDGRSFFIQYSCPFCDWHKPCSVFNHHHYQWLFFDINHHCWQRSQLLFLSTLSTPLAIYELWFILAVFQPILLFLAVFQPAISPLAVFVNCSTTFDWFLIFITFVDRHSTFANFGYLWALQSLASFWTPSLLKTALWLESNFAFDWLTTLLLAVLWLLPKLAIFDHQQVWPLFDFITNVDYFLIWADTNLFLTLIP